MLETIVFMCESSVMKTIETSVGPRERLLEAAGEVFAERGYDAATVREITGRAGANVAAVNYHFRDKEELYAAVLRHAQRCAMESSWVDGGEGTPEKRLGGFVGAMLRHLLDPERPAWHGRLMAREMAAPTRMLSQLIDEGFRPKVTILEGIVRDIVGSSLSGKRVHLLAASVLAQCVFYRQSRPVIAELFPGLLEGEDAIAPLAEHITTFSLAGIRAAARAKQKTKS